MFSNTKALLAIVSCALVAHAQSTEPTTTASASPSQTSAAGLDSCILNCVSTAATSSGCISYTNLTCVCTSSAFQQAAAGCLVASCTVADQETAAQLQSAECAALGSGNATTSTAPSTATSTAAASTTSSASASTSAKSTSAAMALSAPFSFGSLVGTLAASAGVLFGAAFVF